MSRRGVRESGALVYGMVPRAHLMPPAVAIQRKERGRRRSLISLTIVVLAATVAGVVGSSLFAADAEARLAQERRTTEQLLATQLEFTEVTLVRGQTQSITDVRNQLATLEVLWRDTVNPYLGVLGDDEVVETLTFSSNAPARPPIGTTGPLREPRVATISMVVVTTELPAPQVWFRQWQLIDTYADASIDSITLQQQGYKTTITINLNDLALSQRFAEEEATE